MSIADHHVVYRVDFLPTGQFYIGKTRLDRWLKRSVRNGKPYCGSGKAIMKLVRENPIECFQRRLLSAFGTAQAAYDYEAEVVDFMHPQSLNRCEGGMGASGLKGRKCTDEQRARMSAAQKKRPPPSAETRAKMSMVRKGRKFTPEHRAKMSESRKGRKPTAEHRSKLSEAQLRRWARPEEKSKMCAAQQRRRQRARAEGLASQGEFMYGAAMNIGGADADI